MTQKTYRTRPQQRQALQQGAGMIEILVAMLLVAFWLLGNAGLQAGALKYQRGAQSRLTAVEFAADLSERMESNAIAARLGDFEVSINNTGTTATKDCATSACTPREAATYDLSNWTTRLTQALILPEATVSMVVAASITTYTITISWDEPRGRQTYADSTSKTERMTFTTTKVIRNA